MSSSYSYRILIKIHLPDSLQQKFISSQKPVGILPHSIPMFKNETRKSTAGQQPIIPSSAEQIRSRNSINPDYKRPSIVFSEKDLTFPTFARSDLTKFDVRVVGNRNKVLAPTVHSLLFTPYLQD